ncbi:uncharacterized protein LOC142169731 [Nicotiana tabacum]|uniref:Uncharacterized protein LOC142169731 n=1 Tax=Nicotiana tabacum TaxID=4097 RepID=A0AC58SRY7_TOBAC
MIEDVVSQQRKELIDTGNLFPRNICKSKHEGHKGMPKPRPITRAMGKATQSVEVSSDVLWSAEFDAVVAENNEQQITLKITRKNDGEVVWFTTVYAKSKQHLRVPLWDNLIHCNNYIDDPWCICGDFNAIMSPEEKKGGNPHRMEKSWKFISCMEDCGMVYAGYKGLRPPTSSAQSSSGTPKWLKYEESILKQRKNIKWIEEGDSNTKYFHAIINERRRRASIQRIQRSDGQWINGEEDIAREAVEYFLGMFKDEGEPELEHLDCIDQKVTHEDNIRLCGIPDEEEIRKATGFLKERFITKNILLAQEIIHGIGKKHFGGNTLIKLDMAKAYDRVNWKFLLNALRKFGFSENWIALVWRGFSIVQSGPHVIHLAYADDVVIFSSGGKRTLKLVMHQLQNYEKCSGQLINTRNNCFLVHPKASKITIQRIKEVTGYMHANFPITYLGCPLYVGRKRISHFSEIVSKLVKRTTGWQGKLLSFGGRATHIKHILQSQPIYLLSALEPPKTVLKQLETYMVRFF